MVHGRREREEGGREVECRVEKGREVECGVGLGWVGLGWLGKERGRDNYDGNGRRRGNGKVIRKRKEIRENNVLKRKIKSVP